MLSVKCDISDPTKLNGSIVPVVVPLKVEVLLSSSSSSSFWAEEMAAFHPELYPRHNTDLDGIRGATHRMLRRQEGSLVRLMQNLVLRLFLS